MYFSSEQSAWQFEERGHLTGTVQVIVENCLVWVRILVGGACEKSDFNRCRINVQFDLPLFLIIVFNHSILYIFSMGYEPATEINWIWNGSRQLHTITTIATTTTRGTTASNGATLQTCTPTVLTGSSVAVNASDSLMLLNSVCSCWDVRDFSRLNTAWGCQPQLQYNTIKQNTI